MYSKLGDKLESKGGAVVKALPLTHQCGSGLNFEGNPICGLSLLLVPFLAPLIFSLFTLIFVFPINHCFQIPLRSGQWMKNHYTCGCVMLIFFFYLWLFFFSKPLLFLFLYQFNSI